MHGSLVLASRELRNSRSVSEFARLRAPATIYSLPLVIAGDGSYNLTHRPRATELLRRRRGRRHRVRGTQRTHQARAPQHGHAGPAPAPLVRRFARPGPPVHCATPSSMAVDRVQELAVAHCEPIVDQSRLVGAECPGCGPDAAPFWTATVLPLVCWVLGIRRGSGRAGVTPTRAGAQRCPSGSSAARFP